MRLYCVAEKETGKIVKVSMHRIRERTYSAEYQKRVVFFEIDVDIFPPEFKAQEDL